jgi:hypothetical protein
MPTLRVRFTLRRLMVIVAVAALAVGGPIIIERNRARRDWLSGWHSNLVNGLTKQAISFDMPDAQRSRLWAKIRWHEAMADKYRWAADHPWFPVATDPGQPE